LPTLAIGELSRRSGVPITTLRYYDRIGLLVPKRLSNNRRAYPPEALDLLRLVHLCQALGCSLDEVAEVVRPGGGPARRAIARRRLRDVERRIAELTTAKELLVHFAHCRHTARTAAQCREATARALRTVAVVTTPAPPEDRAAAARRGREVTG
jgi:DNA-binding transcriptional MerR regulator